MVSSLYRLHETEAFTLCPALGRTRSYQGGGYEITPPPEQFLSLWYQTNFFLKLVRRILYNKPTGNFWTCIKTIFSCNLPNKLYSQKYPPCIISCDPPQGRRQDWLQGILLRHHTPCLFADDMLSKMRPVCSIRTALDIICLFQMWGQPRCQGSQWGQWRNGTGSGYVRLQWSSSQCDDGKVGNEFYLRLEHTTYWTNAGLVLGQTYKMTLFDVGEWVS